MSSRLRTRYHPVNDAVVLVLAPCVQQRLFVCVWKRVFGEIVCVCMIASTGERAARVTAPLPKVTSKESQANYYADQSWWRLRGLLRCNHISWPKRNLQADPNHRGYSGRVSQDGGLPSMFSFHKTLFPLSRAGTWLSSQTSVLLLPPPVPLGLPRACTCIYISQECLWATAHTVQGPSVRPFWAKGKDGPVWQTDTFRVDHRYSKKSSRFPCLFCHRFLFAPLLLSHMSTRWKTVCDLLWSWRADWNLLSSCGWDVCVQVVNMPPLSFFFFFLLFSLCCTLFSHLSVVSLLPGQ